VAAVGLLVFYLLVHWAVVRLAPGLPKWLGAIVANGPAGAVFFLGLPGGLIFGKGEGAEAVLLYVGVSLVVMALRAEAGCEVMTLPNMIFGRSTQLPCLLFSPIDALERRMGRKNSAFPG
jgi:predicted permease